VEGYVNVSDGGKFNYVYNYTDHLGNIRVSYTLNPADGQLKILEENHYYPFGLKHSNYNVDKVDFVKDETGFFVILKSVERNKNQYKYNGKEFQDELGLNWYDYQARNYDPAIGRWMNIDPLAEQYRRWSPYTYAVDNPIFFIDPDGMEVIPGTDGKAVSYTKKSDGTLAWSANASADTQRIGNGLARTVTGMAQLDKARDVAHNVSFKVDTESESNRYGVTIINLSEDKNGNVKIKSAEITVFEKPFKAFKALVDAGAEFKDPQAQELAKISNDMEGMISATSGHEIDHATDKENAQQSYDNMKKGTSYDTEKKAEATESKIIEELQTK
jgi:RHS repeat-associated protein